MKSTLFKYFFFLLLLLAAGSCSKNDDDTQVVQIPPYIPPTVNSQPVCDSSNVPVTDHFYEFFPYSPAGQPVVFTDSAGMLLDTLIIPKGKYSFYSSLKMHVWICLYTFSSRIKTNWKIPGLEDRDYQVVFQYDSSISIVEANSVFDEVINNCDFYAGGVTNGQNAGFTFQDSIEVNGSQFQDVFILTCTGHNCSDCNFLKKMVFARNDGLVAYNLSGSWWTKI